MIRKSIQEELGRILSPGQIRYQEPMDRHCSFRTGGPADAMVFVRTRQELADVLRLLTSEGEEWFILGRGTNLLVGDGAIMALVVLSILPIVIFYFACQKYIIEGVVSGAVKG